MFTHKITVIANPGNTLGHHSFRSFTSFKYDHLRALKTLLWKCLDPVKFEATKWAKCHLLRGNRVICIFRLHLGYYQK
ncbi:hypothetical protein EG68_10255 [Paragonimus skrjabini miyazakii]|uniref:Uncharacterized protein n=1 Tax=Paragonimus skrjabini miyazakii TaxID=59628 RepID=A0A8S9YCT8_9TREM|nr:hypothetical protein EG68_10255 [Paragonimus skrjabini miyazakii]